MMEKLEPLAVSAAEAARLLGAESGGVPELSCGDPCLGQRGRPAGVDRAADKGGGPMTGKERTRAGTAIPTRAVESGTVCKTAHASTEDNTTIGGGGQMVSATAVLFNRGDH